MATGTTVELEINSDDTQLAAILELVRSGKIDLPPEFGNFEIFLDEEPGEGEERTRHEIHVDGDADAGQMAYQLEELHLTKGEDVVVELEDIRQPPSPTPSQQSDRSRISLYGALRRDRSGGAPSPRKSFSRKCVCCQMLHESRVSAEGHTFLPTFNENDLGRRLSVDSNFTYNRQVWRPAGKVSAPIG